MVKIPKVPAGKSSNISFIPIYKGGEGGSADDAASASMRLLRRPANATDMVAEVTLLVARGGLAAD